MVGINKELSEDWIMGVNDFTLKEGIIFIPNSFDENGQPEYYQGDLKLTFNISDDPMKNYLKLRGFSRPPTGEFLTREFDLTGDDTYKIEKASEILYVARSLFDTVQEVVSSSSFKVSAQVANILTEYDDRFLENDRGGELICKIKSGGNTYVKAFSISGQTVSLRDIKDWETGATGSTFTIGTLAVGDSFSLINAYDVLPEGLEETTGYPTYGYGIKHVEASGSWIKFNKYDKPNKSISGKLLITYYPLSDFSPEYPYWDKMNRYGTYAVEENIDFPIISAQEIELLNNFKKYLDPLITMKLITKRPTVLKRGQEVVFTASRYPQGIFKIINNSVKTETENGGNNGRGNKVQTITFANYTDNWAKIISRLKNRNDISKVKLAQNRKQQTDISLRLTVLWSQPVRSMTAPSAPTNLVIVDSGVDFITFSWDLVSGAAYYGVIISENSDLSSPIETGIAYDNDFTFEGLSSGIAFYLGVYSVNSAGESSISTISQSTLLNTIIYVSDKDTRLYLYKTDFAKSYDDKLTGNTMYIESEFVTGQIRSDGQYICFEGDISTSNNQILAFKVSDSSVINMTHDNSYQYRYPVFKPDDNDYIYYTNQSVGNGEIFRSDIATQTQTQLRATGSLEIRNILFNEDGSKLLCNLKNPTGSIWSISYVLTSNYAGSFVELVNRSTNPIYEMNWNHDFTKLCFASDVGGVSQLFECNADGTSVTQRTTGANNKRCPVYSPDGTKILFRRQSGSDYPIWSADTTYDMSGYFDNQAVWVDETGNRIESPIDWKGLAI